MGLTDSICILSVDVVDNDGDRSWLPTNIIK